MKILFDTNVLFDIWAYSQDFEHSFAALDVALLRGFQPAIAVTMAPDFVYLIEARTQRSWREARALFGNILDLFTILDVTGADCRRAYESTMRDLEDAFIAFSAQRNNVDFIVTRNKRDFVASPVPALTPCEFIALYKPENIEYGTDELAQ